jgi:hypothetical protein
MAQMSRADCLISQSAHNSARRADGVAQYERIMERLDVPADYRAQAAFKWAYNLAKLGDTTRATDAYWMSLNSFLGPNAPQLGAQGRYWVARSCVELGQLLEQASRFDEARRVYRLMLGSKLPGAALAQARIERLDQPAPAQ